MPAAASTVGFVGLRVAVILPCFNEASTITEVILQFRTALPSAQIFVFDNNSTDGTAGLAQAAGAMVVREMRQGKGHVVRRMFAEVEADIYIMADGDGTYDAAQAPSLVETLVSRRADMVVGTRRDVVRDAGRTGHAFGNRIFNELFAQLFGREYTDIFSGYRVFTRRFAKSFPAVSAGFEIETEMSVHATQLMMPVVEVECDYGVRPEGSTSKLRTLRDGFRILMTFMLLMKEAKPLKFFGYAAAACFVTGLALGLPVVVEFLNTGLVDRLPTAVLAASLVIISSILFGCGLILDSLSRARLEHKRLVYLSLPALPVT